MKLVNRTKKQINDLAFYSPDLNGGQWFSGNDIVEMILKEQLTLAMKQVALKKKVKKRKKKTV